jgi:hypothetical protein
MTTARPTAFPEDHGDQFPGAVPAPAPAPEQGPSDRLVRMHAAYVHKVNALVTAGEDHLAHELAQGFEEESAEKPAAERRSAGRHVPGRGQAGRRPGRVSGFARRSLERFDRYTLDVFNAGTPYRSRDDRSA